MGCRSLSRRSGTPAVARSLIVPSSAASTDHERLRRRVLSVHQVVRPPPALRYELKVLAERLSADRVPTDKRSLYRTSCGSPVQLPPGRTLRIVMPSPPPHRAFSWDVPEDFAYSCPVDEPFCPVSSGLPDHLLHCRLRLPQQRDPPMAVPQCGARFTAEKASRPPGVVPAFWSCDLRSLMISSFATIDEFSYLHSRARSTLHGEAPPSNCRPHVGLRAGRY